MTTPEPRRELPGGAHLAYSCLHEIRGKGRPDIAVTASLKGSGGGSRWEFTIEEIATSTSFARGETAVRIKIYDESFAAFTEIPSFFAALASVRPNSMTDVYALLGRIGAVDETPDFGPSATRRERLRAGIVDRLTGLPVSAERTQIADVVLDLLGETADD